MDFMQQTLLFYLAVFLAIFASFSSGGRRAVIRAGEAILGVLRGFRRRRMVAERVRVMLGKQEAPSMQGVFLVTIFYLLSGYIILSKVFFFAVVLGNSMYPVLEKGDLVLVQTLSRDPEVGDIILFSGFIERDVERRQYVLHRVYEVTPEGIITKGDAMPAPDPWVVPRDRILGKAVTIAGKPLAIPGAGEALIVEPGREPSRTSVLYLLGIAQRAGTAMFIGFMLIYLLSSLRRARAASA